MQSKIGLGWICYVLCLVSLLIRKHDFIPDECKPQDTSRDSGLSNTGKCNRVVWNHFFQHNSDANKALWHFSRCSTGSVLHLQLCYKWASWIHWAGARLNQLKGRTISHSGRKRKYKRKAAHCSSAPKLIELYKRLRSTSLVTNLDTANLNGTQTKRPGDSQLMPIQVMQYCNKHKYMWHTQYEFKYELYL